MVPTARLDRHRFRLDNGLRLIVAPLEHARTAAFSLLVAVGSRDDPPEKRGLTHFLEHMLFRGTERYPGARRLNVAIEALGAPLDASVLRDHTLFEMPTFPEAIPDCLELLGELLQRPTFPDLRLEREVVLQEQLDEVGANGRATDADNVAMRALFPDQGLGWSIIGTRRSVKRIAEVDLRAHMSRFYTAGRMVLAVAGAVDPEVVRRAAQLALGSVPRGVPAAPRRARPRPELPSVVLASNDDSQADFDLTCLTAPIGHDDAEALSLIVRLLDDGEAARLRARLCDDLGLAYEAGAHQEAYRDHGLLRVSGAVSPSRVVEVTREAAKVLASLRDEWVPPEELERVRRRLHLDLLMALESPESVSSWLVDMARHRPSDDIDTVLGRLLAQGADDVRRVANRYLRAERAQLTVVGPVRRERRSLNGVLAELDSRSGS